MMTDETQPEQPGGNVLIGGELEGPPPVGWSKEMVAIWRLGNRVASAEGKLDAHSKLVKDHQEKLTKLLSLTEARDLWGTRTGSRVDEMERRVASLEADEGDEGIRKLRADVHRLTGRNRDLAAANRRLFEEKQTLKTRVLQQEHAMSSADLVEELAGRWPVGLRLAVRGLLQAAESGIHGEATDVE